MADGGASNMILLVTSLLICGAASGILLQSWTQTASSVGTNQEQLALDSKTKVTLSGDLAKTVFNSIDDRINIFVQNSGSSILDENEFGAFVEGQSASVVVPTPIKGSKIRSFCFEYVEIKCLASVNGKAAPCSFLFSGVVPLNLNTLKLALAHSEPV